MPDETPQTTPDEVSAAPEPRSRLDSIKECDLDPGSLVCSYFHKLDGYGDVLWQGVVVGEPQPGIYMLELFDWEEGRGYQVVVSLADMLHGNPEQEWRFYDSEELMRLGYDRPPRAIEHDSTKR